MELGFSIENGCIVFDFLLLNRNEFLTSSGGFFYRNVKGDQERMDLPAGSLAYTICQVPILLQASDEPCIKVYLCDGGIQQINGYILNSVNSMHIFQRDHIVHHLVVSISRNQ
jgi:hypothetical protein